MDIMYLSVCIWNDVITDVTIPLVIYFIFSKIIRESLFNLS